MIFGRDFGGQADSDKGRFAAGREYTAYGHELGHTLGLQHFGRAAWLSWDGTSGTNDFPLKETEFNCSPHYYSTMNYAYGNEPAHYRFSDLTAMVHANSQSVNEINSFVGFARASLNGGVFGVLFNLAPDRLDWNYSESFANVAVSAPLRFANSSCRALSEGAQKVAGLNTRGSPAIARSSTRVHMFYIRETPIGSGTWRLHTRQAPLGNQETGSCTDHDNPLDYGSAYSLIDGCLDWSAEQNLNLDARDVDALWDPGSARLFVATRSDADRLVVTRYSVGASGTLATVGGSTITPLGVQVESSPSLVAMRAPPSAGAGWSRRVAVVYGQTGDAVIRAHHWNGTSWLAWDGFAEGRDELGQEHTLSGNGWAAIFSWPDEQNTIASSDLVVTCGLFVSDSFGMRAYCYDPVEAEWAELTEQVWAGAPAGPNCGDGWVWDPLAGAAGACLLATSIPPSLTFRYERSDTGAPRSLSSARGNLQLVYANIEGGTPRPRARISMPVSSTRHPSTGQWNLNVAARQGWFMNEWHHSLVSSRLDAYEDSSMGGMFALQLGEDGDVWFFPHADGTPNTDLWVGNDFAVMEDYTCHYTAVDAVVACGDVNVFDFF